MGAYRFYNIVHAFAGVEEFSMRNPEASDQLILVVMTTHTELCAFVVD